MKTLIHTLLNWLVSRLRQRWHLSLEYLALRHQVEVLKRSAKRPHFSPVDRGLWLILSRLWSRWPQAVEMMQVNTVKRWGRQGFWRHVGWRRRRKRPGRPPVPSETRNLIREMSRDNRLWGAPRIHGELLKLGIKASRTTVAKYMMRRPGSPSPTWRSFWRMHAPDVDIEEVYAELAGRYRTVSAQVFRLIQRLRHGCWRFIAWWGRRSRGRRTTTAFTELHNAVSGPAVWTIDVADYGRVCGRSPPHWVLSSRHHRFQIDASTEMRRANMRLALQRREGENTVGQAALHPWTTRNAPKPDNSHQAAA